MLPPRYGHQVVAARGPRARRGAAKFVVRVQSDAPAAFLPLRMRFPSRARSRSSGDMTVAIKPIERLVPVSCVRCRTSTPGLSTWWSSTALKGELVSRGASRLDAFSGYPVRT